MNKQSGSTLGRGTVVGAGNSNSIKEYPLANLFIGNRAVSFYRHVTEFRRKSCSQF